MLQPWHAMTMSSLYHPFTAFCRRKSLVVWIQLMYLPTARQSLAGPWLDTYAGARFSLDLKTAAVHRRTHTHSTHLFPQHSCLQLSSITCYLAPAVFFYTILSEATMLCFQASSFHLLSFSSSILGFSCATDGRLRSKRVCFTHIWLE